MTKNANVIQLDYENAHRQIEILKQAGANVGNEVKHLGEYREGICKYWRGEAVQNYINKISVVEKRLEDISWMLKSVAEALEEDAKALRNAELQALQTAQTRNS